MVRDCKPEHNGVCGGFDDSTIQLTELLETTEELGKKIKVERS